MSRKTKLAARIDSGSIEIKSKFEAEFRRVAVDRRKPPTYEFFHSLLERLHHLASIPFIITYVDPTDGDLLPINNDNNFAHALATARPLLRLLLQYKGKSDVEVSGYGSLQRRPRPLISKLIPSAGISNGNETKLHSSIAIGLPEDFRRVSAIIDVDILPESQRRVRLMKNGSDRPLGFYIRDGTSIRVTEHGLEKVPGVFISRLVPGGLAEGTGLLAVNDEVLEVNGIEVAGKTLDQVTDMMVANSANLIITVKPINQHNNVTTLRRGMNNTSNGDLRQQQQQPAHSQHIVLPPAAEPLPEEDVEEDEDEVQEHLDREKFEKPYSAITSTGNNNGELKLEGDGGVKVSQVVIDDDEETSA